MVRGTSQGRRSSHGRRRGTGPIVDIPRARAPQIPSAAHYAPCPPRQIIKQLDLFPTAPTEGIAGRPTPATSRHPPQHEREVWSAFSGIGDTPDIASSRVPTRQSQVDTRPTTRQHLPFHGFPPSRVGTSHSRRGDVGRATAGSGFRLPPTPPDSSRCPTAQAPGGGRPAPHGVPAGVTVRSLRNTTEDYAVMTKRSGVTFSEHQHEIREQCFRLFSRYAEVVARQSAGAAKAASMAAGNTSDAVTAEELVDKLIATHTERLQGKLKHFVDAILQLQQTMKVKKATAGREAEYLRMERRLYEDDPMQDQLEEMFESRKHYLEGLLEERKRFQAYIDEVDALRRAELEKKRQQEEVKKKAEMERMKKDLLEKQQKEADEVLNRVRGNVKDHGGLRYTRPGAIAVDGGKDERAFNDSTPASALKKDNNSRRGFEMRGPAGGTSKKTVTISDPSQRRATGGSKGRAGGSVAGQHGGDSTEGPMAGSIPESVGTNSDASLADSGVGAAFGTTTPPQSRGSGHGGSSFVDGQSTRHSSSVSGTNGTTKAGHSGGVGSDSTSSSMAGSVVDSNAANTFGRMETSVLIPQATEGSVSNQDGEVNNAARRGGSNPFSTLANSKSFQKAAAVASAPSASSSGTRLGLSRKSTETGGKERKSPKPQEDEGATLEMLLMEYPDLDVADDEMLLTHFDNVLAALRSVKQRINRVSSQRDTVVSALNSESSTPAKTAGRIWAGKLRADSDHQKIRAWYKQFLDNRSNLKTELTSMAASPTSPRSPAGGPGGGGRIDEAELLARMFNQEEALFPAIQACVVEDLKDVVRLDLVEFAEETARLQRDEEQLEQVKKECDVMMNGTEVQKKSMMESYMGEIRKIKKDLGEELPDENDPMNKYQLNKMNPFDDDYVDMVDIGIQNTIEQDVATPLENKISRMYQQQLWLHAAMRNMVVATSNISSFHQNLDVVLACRACFRLVSHARIIYPCGHTFCNSCLDEMFVDNETIRCDDCGMISHDGCVPNDAIASIVMRFHTHEEGAQSLLDQLMSLTSTIKTIEEDIRDGAFLTVNSEVLLSDTLKPDAGLEAVSFGGLPSTSPMPSPKAKNAILPPSRGFSSPTQSPTTKKKKIVVEDKLGLSGKLDRAMAKLKAASVLATARGGLSPRRSVGSPIKEVASPTSEVDASRKNSASEGNETKGSSDVVVKKIRETTDERDSTEEDLAVVSIALPPLTAAVSAFEAA